MNNRARSALFALCVSAALCSTTESRATEPSADASSAFVMAPALMGYAPPLAPSLLSGPLAPSVTTTTPRPAMRPYSIGLMVGGIVATPLGGILVVGGLLGAAYVGLFEDPCSDPTSPRETCTNDPIGTTVPLLIAGAGLLVIGGGVTMIIVGAREVPVEPQVALRVSPTGLSVQGRF